MVAHWTILLRWRSKICSNKFLIKFGQKRGLFRQFAFFVRFYPIMNVTESKWTGVIYAALAAILFGASTPFAKLLLGTTQPVLLAALLYLGSGVSLSVWLLLTKKFGKKSKEANLKKADLPWLAGAIFAGGIVAPILLLFGLNLTTASTASLLLNLEGVLTAVLAWFVFKENFDRRIAFGMLFITVGGIVLSWAGKPEIGLPWGILLIIGACLMWAIDNNLTRKVSAVNPLQIAALKGLVAGIVNLIIALIIGAKLPNGLSIGSAAVVGLLGYGVSLSCFVLALRHIGTARTGAYFSLAPFVGALISIVLLGDSLTISFFIAAVLMAIGVYFHLTEQHEHEHEHSPFEHEHKHTHDEHHQHEHAADISITEPHSHRHQHAEMMHEHDHFPDLHHQH